MERGTLTAYHRRRRNCVGRFFLAGPKMKGETICPSLRAALKTVICRAAFYWIKRTVRSLGVIEHLTQFEPQSHILTPLGIHCFMFAQHFNFVLGWISGAFKLYLSWISPKCMFHPLYNITWLTKYCRQWHSSHKSSRTKLLEMCWIVFLQGRNSYT